MKEKTAPNGNWLYPHHPAPGRGWCRAWRQSRWSVVSGWRPGGTCWGCWCPSSPSTGLTSPGARRPEPHPQVRGRAAAAVAGAGFSPVPFGTASSGAAAADACSGEGNTHPDKCGMSPGARGEAGSSSLCQRSRCTLCDPTGQRRRGKAQEAGSVQWLVVSLDSPFFPLEADGHQAGAAEVGPLKQVESTPKIKGLYVHSDMGMSFPGTVS